MNKLDILLGLLSSEQIVELFKKVESIKESILPSINPEIDELHTILSMEVNKIYEQNGENKKTIK